MSFYLALGCGLLVLLWLAGGPWYTTWRRRRLRARPFPPAWRDILRRRLPYFRLMPTNLQLQLKRQMQVFLAEKRFIGRGGLVVTEEMRVTIAAQACLLLLNRRTDYYPFLRQILLYPDAFIVDRIQSDALGLHQHQRRLLSGESWTQSQVILSWSDALEGAADAADGRNVVIHEFAHQLDQEEGQANGAPPLRTREDYARWSTVLGDAYLRLQHAASADEPSLFSHYGATNPAEFFAVASEVFFEQPARLAAEYAALYRELSGYYCVDPVSWN